MEIWIISPCNQSKVTEEKENKKGTGTLDNRECRWYILIFVLKIATAMGSIVYLTNLPFIYYL